MYSAGNCLIRFDPVAASVRHRQPKIQVRRDRPGGDAQLVFRPVVFFQQVFAALPDRHTAFERCNAALSAQGKSDRIATEAGTACRADSRL